MIEAIVFDFDGTLVDTETPQFHAMQSVYNDHGLDLDPTWWASFIGTLTDATEAALDRLTPEVAVSRAFLYDSARERYREALHKSGPRPGVEALLAECRSAGVKVAIATNAPKSWVQRHLNRVQLADWFDTIVSVDEVRYGKPHPEPYSTACHKIGALPQRCVAVEDSPTGVASAVAAGLFTVAVRCFPAASVDLSQAHVELDSLANVDLDGLFRMLSNR